MAGGCIVACGADVSGICKFDRRSAGQVVLVKSMTEGLVDGLTERITKA